MKARGAKLKNHAVINVKNKLARHRVHCYVTPKHENNVYSNKTANYKVLFKCTTCHVTKNFSLIYNVKVLHKCFLQKRCGSHCSSVLNILGLLKSQLAKLYSEHFLLSSSICGERLLNISSSEALRVDYHFNCSFT